MEETNLYKHYITVDSKNRIVDGFTDFEKEPGEHDICIREDSESRIFELFGNDAGRNLFFCPMFSPSTAICLYKYEDEEVKFRTKEELEEDLPERPYEPSTEDLVFETLGDHEFRLCLIELGVI